MSVDLIGEGPVAVVRLGRAEDMNVIDAGVLQGLRDDLDEAAALAVRGVVITGGSRSFCAGADLGLLESALAGDAREALNPIMDLLESVVVGMRRLPFPTVCAIEGPAVGAGMSLALAGDMRTAGRSASMVPGFLRVGTSPDGGFSSFACRALGSARALSLLIRNQRLTSANLLSLGLVEVVAEDGGAVDAAVELLTGLAPVSPLALVHVRELMETAWTLPLERQLERERGFVTQMWDSVDFREGVGAFLEKRIPRYIGA